jgi:hypothetical protein
MSISLLFFNFMLYFLLTVKNFIHLKLMTELYNIEVFHYLTILTLLLSI